MSTFFTLVWFGGCWPSYGWHRENGYTILGSFFSAIAWPFDFGWKVSAWCAGESDET